MKHFTWKKVLAATIVAAFTVCANAQTKFGYCNADNVTARNSVTRVGNTSRQGIAIRIGKEKLQLLKGKTIKAVNTVVGTRNTTDDKGVTNNKATIFITKKLGENSIVEQELALTSKNTAAWVEFALDNPYTITGDEGELYIGYSLYAQTTNNPLSADRTADSKDCCYAWKNGEWTDMYGLGLGMANVQIVLDSELQTVDAMVKTFNAADFRKAGVKSVFDIEILNLGTETITGFDLGMGVSGEESESKTYTCNLAPGSTMKLNDVTMTASKFGKQDVVISIDNVNGKQDADMADNQTNSTIMFYPEDMQKVVFVEGFTGMTCPNCPSGHRILNEAIENCEKKGIDIIEVSHHSGYAADLWTSKVDAECTLFFGMENTFAPGMMFDRHAVPALANQGTHGIVTPMNSSIALAEAGIRYAAQQEPYVAMKLTTEWNEQTRDLTVTVDALALNDLPEGQNVLNILLVQDNMIGYQVNGSDRYNHSGVVRRGLCSSAWGVGMPQEVKAGMTKSHTVTYNLPEKLQSDYYTEANVGSYGFALENVTFPTVVEDMRVVAFIGSYAENSYLGHDIYNSIEARLGQTAKHGGFDTDFTGIHEVITDSSIKAENSGRKGIFDMQGRRVSTPKHGLYIVNGKKVML